MSAITKEIQLSISRVSMFFVLRGINAVDCGSFGLRHTFAVDTGRRIRAVDVV